MGYQAPLAFVKSEAIEWVGEHRPERVPLQTDLLPQHAAGVERERREVEDTVHEHDRLAARDLDVVVDDRPIDGIEPPNA